VCLSLMDFVKMNEIGCVSRGQDESRTHEEEWDAVSESQEVKAGTEIAAFQAPNNIA